MLMVFQSMLLMWPAALLLLLSLLRHVLVVVLVRREQSLSAVQSCLVLSTTLNCLVAPNHVPNHTLLLTVAQLVLLMLLELLPQPLSLAALLMAFLLALLMTRLMALQLAALWMAPHTRPKHDVRKRQRRASLFEVPAKSLARVDVHPQAAFRSRRVHECNQ